MPIPFAIPQYRIGRCVEQRSNHLTVEVHLDGEVGRCAETQGRAVAFRTHQCLFRQRTQLINALRGHLAEFGVVAPKGPANLKVLQEADEASDLPVAVRAMGTIYLDQIAGLTQVPPRDGCRMSRSHLAQSH